MGRKRKQTAHTHSLGNCRLHKLKNTKSQRQKQSLKNELHFSVQWP